MYYPFIKTAEYLTPIYNMAITFPTL